MTAGAAAEKPTLLTVENLTVATSGNEHEVVKNVSFAARPGQVTAIVGESGSGKTMLSRAILRLLPQGLVVAAGTIGYKGSDLLALPPNELRQIRGAEIGMVFQEPMTSLNPALSIGKQMEEGLSLHSGLDRGERRQRMIDMLARVGIPDPELCLSAYPHEFSGGMRQRIMLASVMLPRPSLLIADEPTTALDAVVQRQVMDLMVAVTREHDTALLLISHDLSMVAHYASHVIVMQNGEIVEQGGTKELLLAPRHPYTRRLLDSLPRRVSARPPVDGKAVIEVSNLAVDYEGRRKLLGRRPSKRAVDGVSLALRPGETVAVVGGSGSGKTTLGRAIIGLVKNSGGHILFNQQDPFADRARRKELCMALQIVFQDPYSSLDPRMRVGQLVAEPLRHKSGMARPDRDQRVLETLQEVGLSVDHLDRFPHQLSGGQRQRVAIARAIVGRPEVVIADEPVSALDMTVQKQILELFVQLQRSYGFACLFISHDLAAVEQIADRVLVMNQGKVVEAGTRDEVFDNPSNPYTRELLSAMNVLEKEGSGFKLSRRGGAWLSTSDECGIDGNATLVVVD